MPKKEEANKEIIVKLDDETRRFLVTTIRRAIHDEVEDLISNKLWDAIYCSAKNATRDTYSTLQYYIEDGVANWHRKFFLQLLKRIWIILAIPIVIIILIFVF